MKNIRTTLTVLFSAVLLMSCAAKKDREAFLKEAARAGMAEVRLSELAVDKAAHPDVREFAGKMITDHGKVNDEVAALAAKKGADLPEEISEDQEAAIDNLSERAGMDFDKGYMDQVIGDHEAAVALFRKQADEGRDKDVKAFAARTLPTLEMHLTMARELRARLDQPGAYAPAEGDPLHPDSVLPPGAPPAMQPMITPGAAPGVPGGS